MTLHEYYRTSRLHPRRLDSQFHSQHLRQALCLKSLWGQGRINADEVKIVSLRITDKSPCQFSTSFVGLKKDRLSSSILNTDITGFGPPIRGCNVRGCLSETCCVSDLDDAWVDWLRTTHQFRKFDLKYSLYRALKRLTQFMDLKKLRFFSRRLLYSNLTFDHE